MSSENNSGKSKGGKARAESLSPVQRKEISQKALKAKAEAAMLPKVTHGSPDHPLKIGDIEIPCYVIEGDRRVLSHSGLIGGLGMKYGSNVGGADRLTSFISGKSISSFVSGELSNLITNPIKFRAPNNKIAYGYDAQILADICDAVLAARKAGVLQKQQLHIAEQCEVLMRGFARVGIVALVDEVTGYQRDRAKDALAKILETFVAKELQPWVKTFPSDFYENMFRLRSLDYPGNGVKRPQYFGHLTNDIIYRRLAPCVWKELKDQAEKDEKGRLKHRLFQKLTTDIGHPKLKELVVSVITVMKLSDHWNDFKSKLDRVHPAYNETMLLPLALEGDSGKGI